MLHDDVWNAKAGLESKYPFDEAGAKPDLGVAKYPSELLEQQDLLVAKLPLVDAAANTYLTKPDAGSVVDHATPHTAAVTWPRVTVVIPAKNEARNLPYVLARIPKDTFEVILVDGHSTDDTIAVARSVYPAIRVLQDSRKGKGNALACGFAAAKGDVIVMLDADGSADAAEIPTFVEALLAGADIAKGSRFVTGGGSSDITRIRRFGNWALTTFVNTLYGTHYTDLCYGYNAFWSRCLPVLSVDCDGFEVETLINVRVAKAGLQVTEVPSFEADRLHGVSNLRAGRDGQRVLKTILREWWNWRQPAERESGFARVPSAEVQVSAESASHM